MAVPPSVTTALEPLRADLAATAVLLDYDGTLAPIAPLPHLALAPASVPALLGRLRARAGLVAIITGRALDDLDGLLGMSDLAAAGNHGFELRGGGGPTRLAAGVAERLTALRRAADEWGTWPLAEGVWLEDKGATLSFHVRAAADPAGVAAELIERLRPAAERAGLRVTLGRMVIEVRPGIDRDKGAAARDLLAGAPVTAALSIGDDRTDIDVWRALRELTAEGALDHAVCLAVASAEAPPEVAAAADAVLADPAAVVAALEYLLEPVAGH